MFFRNDVNGDAGPSVPSPSKRLPAPAPGTPTPALAFTFTYKPPHAPYYPGYMSLKDIIYEDTQPDAGTDCSSTLYNPSETHGSGLCNDQATSMHVDDDEPPQPPPRTSHAEAFGTVDWPYLKRMRNRPEPTAPGLLGAVRRKLLGQGAKSQVAAAPLGACDSQYKPPWLTLVSRTEQEKREKRARVARNSRR